MIGIDTLLKAIDNKYDSNHDEILSKFEKLSTQEKLNYILYSDNNDIKNVKAQIAKILADKNKRTTLQLLDNFNTTIFGARFFLVIFKSLTLIQTDSKEIISCLECITLLSSTLNQHELNLTGVTLLNYSPVICESIKNLDSSTLQTFYALTISTINSLGKSLQKVSMYIMAVKVKATMYSWLPYNFGGIQNKTKTKELPEYSNNVNQYIKIEMLLADSTIKNFTNQVKALLNLPDNETYKFIKHYTNFLTILEFILDKNYKYCFKLLNSGNKKKMIQNINIVFGCVNDLVKYFANARSYHSPNVFSNIDKISLYNLIACDPIAYYYYIIKTENEDKKLLSYIYAQLICKFHFIPYENDINLYEYIKTACPAVIYNFNTLLQSLYNALGVNIILNINRFLSLDVYNKSLQYDMICFDEYYKIIIDFAHNSIDNNRDPNNCQEQLDDKLNDKDSENTIVTPTNNQLTTNLKYNNDNIVLENPTHNSVVESHFEFMNYELKTDIKIKPSDSTNIKLFKYLRSTMHSTILDIDQYIHNVNNINELAT